MKLYGYLGVFLIAFAVINFYLVLQPFALLYIPIIWFGYIFIVDSLVFKLRKKSFVASYPKEFLLMVLVSVPFWGISEFYNFYSSTWIYGNYLWYVHVIDFLTILPAVAETFALVSALRIFEGLRVKLSNGIRDRHVKLAGILFLLLGAFFLVSPFALGFQPFPLVWLGLFMFLDPINLMIGNDSIFGYFMKGDYRRIPRLSLAGLIMGFFWELWNYLAYPKWAYNMPWLPLSNVKIFAMPLLGYLGYLPFALSVYAFYTLVRTPLFGSKKNPLEGI